LKPIDSIFANLGATSRADDTVCPAQPKYPWRDTVMKYFKRRYRRIMWGYLFLLPAILFLILIFFYPLIETFRISLYNWRLLSPFRPFVGLSNYRFVLNNQRFLKSLYNTVVYTLGVVPAELVLGFILAMALNRKELPWKGFFTTVYYIPVVTSMVAVAFIWRWLYEPSHGLINYIAGLLGLPQLRWLLDAKTALLSVMITSVWKAVGNSMVIFLAGLRNIPREYYEAAEIDGAGRWQVLRFITLPLINPTMVFLVITSFIGSFQVFNQIIVMTSQYYDAGGPLDSTRVLVYHIYDVGFRSLKMGEAAASAYILFAIILVATIAQFKLMERRIEY